MRARRPAPRKRRTVSETSSSNLPNEALSAPFRRLRRNPARLPDRRWSFQDAGKRFTEVVEAARHKPQVVTERGKAAVVIIAADDYDRLCRLERLTAPSFAEMLLAMPQGDVAFERLHARLRDVEF